MVIQSKQSICTIQSVKNTLSNCLIKMFYDPRSQLNKAFNAHYNEEK